ELEGPLPHDRAAELVARIAELPRFSSRVVSSGRIAGPPAWERITTFRAEEHAERVELDVPNDAALRAFVGETVSAPLHMGRPLWKVYFIDRPASGTTILLRVHHALADGFALLGVLASLCDGGPES